jgi:hypothetical protein
MNLGSLEALIGFKLEFKLLKNEPTNHCLATRWVTRLLWHRIERDADQAEAHVVAQP